MKKLWLFLVMILCTGPLVGATCVLADQEAVKMQREVEEKVAKEVSQEVIRFHVRANSDDKMDQQVKLKVKDAVVEYMQPMLASVENVEEAKTIICEQLPNIKEVAQEILDTNAVPYGANVFLQEEHFPEKSYGEYTFPAGTYEAVIISLGKGEGSNWWCMLYPGLCFVNETYAVVSEESGEKMEEVLTDEAFAWLTEPEKRKWGFRWQFLNEFLEFPI